MPTTPRHLRVEDRKTIARMSQQKIPQRKIAEHLGVNQSTISREIQRNARSYPASTPSSSVDYEPYLAHQTARKRHAAKPSRRSVLDDEALVLEVISRLERRHSPQQISGALAREGRQISTRTLYNHLRRDKLCGGQLHHFLRINGHRRYRHRNKRTRHKIPDRQEISSRPPEVTTRSRYGDWEVDLIAGKQSSGFILSLYERKSRFAILRKLRGKTSQEVSQEIMQALRGHHVFTLTYDNGLEFSQHQKINQVIGSQSFFCRPHASWEKGGVENLNGLVRQYYPKGSDFSQICPRHLAHVTEELNARPRATLGYLSPAHFLHHLQPRL